MNPALKVRWKLETVDEPELFSYLTGIEGALLAATRALELLRERDYATLANWLNSLRSDRNQIIAELDRRKNPRREAAHG